jgi:hypothetical protein
MRPTYPSPAAAGMRISSDVVGTVKDLGVGKAGSRVDTSTYTSTPSLKDKHARTTISWRRGGSLGKATTRSPMMRDYTTSASRTGPRKRRAEGIQTSASQNSSVRTGRVERNRTRDCAMPSRTFPHGRARDRHIACRCSAAMKAEQQGAERRPSTQRSPAQCCAPDYRRIKAVAATGKAPVGIRCLGPGKA